MLILRNANRTLPSLQNNLNIWLSASRPKTLAASVSPVLMGTAMAYQQGVSNFGVFLLTLLTAMLIQIGTNFCNDYFDFQKGADTHERLGPIRATQVGLVTPSQMRFAFMLAFALAALFGIMLVWRGGFPIALIGFFSIVSGIMYTAGKFSLAYLGISEIFVLVFFGPIAVGGTYYLQTLEWSLASCVAGLSPGLWSVAILCVNNLRDREQDAKAHKKTLVVRFGKAFAQWEYVAVVIVALWMPICLWWSFGFSPSVLWSMGVGVLAVPAAKIIFNYRDARVLNDVLVDTGKMSLLFSVIFSLSLL